MVYKLTDYVANFSTVKDKSRIEVIFLTIFFIFLFIPMSHINQNRVSVKENRLLAKWNPLIKKDGEINYNFGRQYSKWFNDRFNLRQFLTDVHTNITVKLTGKAEKGIVDKNGQVYVDFELNNYSLNKIDGDDYNALIMFDKFLKEHNIELYVLLVPNKKYVYPIEKEFLIKDNIPQNIDNEIKKLNKNNNMHIINPLKEMQIASKENYMYFKTEHHWTDDGAFVGYKELMKEITKKHPDIKVLNEQDFDIKDSVLVRGTWQRKFDWGQAPERLNLPLMYIKKLHNTKYRYYTNKHNNLLKKSVSEAPYNYTVDYQYPEGSDYRVIVLGTSMCENLCEFIPYTFKNVFRLRNNNLFARRGKQIKGMPYKEEFKIMKHYKKTILNYHPDIIIFCIAYFDMMRLSDLFETK